MTQEQRSLLSAEDVAALEAFEGEYASYFGKMKAYLDEFVQAGVESGRFTGRRPTLIWSWLCGTAMPATIWTPMKRIIHRYSAWLALKKMRLAAVPGIIVMRRR